MILPMVYQTSPNVFADASTYVSGLLKRVIDDRGECSVVISGGSSIQHTLEHLTNCEIPWSSLRLYVADERCLPRNDPFRNDTMIYKTLVQPVNIKSEHFFQIPAEHGPVEGAILYTRAIATVDQFDIALLGVGADGHIASLFPNHPSIVADERVIAVRNSPKLPLDRVSVGLTMLRGSTHRIVVVAGEDKRDLIAQINQGQKPPVALVNPTRWFLDSQVANFEGDSAMTIQQGQPT